MSVCGCTAGGGPHGAAMTVMMRERKGDKAKERKKKRKLTNIKYITEKKKAESDMTKNVMWKKKRKKKVNIKINESEKKHGKVIEM